MAASPRVRQRRFETLLGCPRLRSWAGGARTAEVPYESKSKTRGSAQVCEPLSNKEAPSCAAWYPQWRGGGYSSHLPLSPEPCEHPLDLTVPDSPLLTSARQPPPGRITTTFLPLPRGERNSRLLNTSQEMAAAGSQAWAQQPLPPNPSPDTLPDMLPRPPPRSERGQVGRRRKKESRAWDHLQPPRSDHPLWPLPSWQGRPAQFQPSSLPSRPLMGLRASRQLSQGVPDTAGQAFHGERRPGRQRATLNRPPEPHWSQVASGWAWHRDEAAARVLNSGPA